LPLRETLDAVAITLPGAPVYLISSPAVAKSFRLSWGLDVSSSLTSLGASETCGSSIAPMSPFCFE
jgi:hypothetical protein